MLHDTQRLYDAQSVLCAPSLADACATAAPRQVRLAWEAWRVVAKVVCARALVPVRGMLARVSTQVGFVVRSLVVGCVVQVRA